MLLTAKVPLKSLIVIIWFKNVVSFTKKATQAMHVSYQFSIINSFVHSLIPYMFTMCILCVRNSPMC